MLKREKSEEVDLYILENHEYESIITMSEILEIPYSTAQYRVRKLGLTKKVKRDPHRKLERMEMSGEYFDVDAVGSKGNWLF